MTERRLAILGAGPIGLEAALYAARQGWDVDVYERDRPGAHILKWGHVEFFSPWSLNRSPWGEAALREADVPLADDEVCPTGREFVEQYLMPLADLPDLADRVHTGHRVLGVARRDALKPEHVGQRREATGPFVLHLQTEAGERYAEADVVLDTTGVYDEPNGLGPGGLAAIGEADHTDAIDYFLPDILGEDRTDFADRATLVVGAGYSAVTSLNLLTKLRDNAPETDIHWLIRDDAPPYELIPDDPLPARRALGEFGNRAAAGHIQGITPHVGTIRRLGGDAPAGPLEIWLDDQADESEAALGVDRIIANVGYRPRVDLFRELQVHQCYATEGPMDLSASLMAAGSGSADCLDQSSAGADTLTTPEEDFFVLGAKSYGRNSNFLLKVGHEQIRQVFDDALGSPAS